MLFKYKQNIFALVVDIKNRSILNIYEMWAMSPTNEKNILHFEILMVFLWCFLKDPRLFDCSLIDRKMATEKRPSMANCLCTLYKKYDFNMHEGHLLPTKATFVPGCPAFSGLTTHLLFFFVYLGKCRGGGGYKYISIVFFHLRASRIILLPLMQEIFLPCRNINELLITQR